MNIFLLLLAFLGYLKPLNICIILPKNEGKCMFSNENIWLYNPDNLTRWEKDINFGVNNGGNGWRLAGFNDTKFNIYGQDQTGEIDRWQNARKNRTYPFKAKVFLGKDYAGKIRITYVGKIGDSEFSKSKKTIELNVDDNGLLIGFQNYICTDKTDNCFESLVGLDSISDKDAVLKIEKVK